MVQFEVVQIEKSRMVSRRFRQQWRQSLPISRSERFDIHQCELQAVEVLKKIHKFCWN